MENSYNEKGELELENEQYDSAIKFFEQAIAVNAYNELPYFNIGRCYVFKGNYDKARLYFDKAIKLKPDWSKPYEGIGVVFIEQKSYQAGFDNLKKAIELDRNNYLAYCNLGYGYIKCERYNDAKEILTQCILLNPIDELPYNMLGLAFKNLKEYKEAKFYFEKSLLFKPEWDAALTNLSAVLIAMGNYVDAVSYCNRAIVSNPKSDTAYVLLGTCTLKLSSDLKNALHYFKKATEINPENFDANSDLGYCYTRLRDFHNGSKYNAKAVELMPLTYVTRVNYGICLRELGEFSLAEKHLKIAIDLEPKDEPAYKSLARLYRIKGDLENSLIISIEGIKHNPKSEELYWSAGMCYMALLDARAVNFFITANELDPNWEEPFQGLGNYYRKIGNYRKAIFNYNKAIELDANYPPAYHGLFLIPITAFNKEEVCGLPLFLNYIKLSNRNPQTDDFSSVLKHCLDNGLHLLIYDLLNNIYFDSPEKLYKGQDFAELAKHTKQFRQQFSLWEYERKSSQDSLIVEAILNYYMGNPLRTYEIFDHYVEDTVENPIPLIGQYYFALSAIAIMEDHSGCLLNYAIPQANQALQNESSPSIDKYYSALILDLAGFSNDPESHLKILGENGFLPAFYYSQQIRLNSLNKLESKIGLNSDSDYFLNPSVIFIDDDETNMLDRLMPLLHLMENRGIIEAIHTHQISNQIITHSFFSDPHFFSKKIVFTHLVEKVSSNYLEKNNPIVFNEIYGDDSEREIIEFEIGIFKKNKDLSRNGLEYFADILHKSAFTDYYYIKNNYKLPPNKTNYRHFLLLSSRLFEEGWVLEEELILFQKYVTYCAQAVYYVSNDNEILKIGISQIKGYILTYSIWGIRHDFLESVARLLFSHIVGKDSEVLTFSGFKERLQNKN